MKSSGELFVRRHIGPRSEDIREMLEQLGLASLEDLVDRVVPPSIRSKDGLPLESLGHGRSEQEVLADLTNLAEQNQVFRSYIGMGYYDCFTPPVILRNILEDPRWYTPYTPYQPEVSQGRLEALLNFQTMVSDLTGMDLANASLLDEATAAAEALAMCRAIKEGARGAADTPHRAAFFVSEGCHPQTIAVIRTRAEPLGIDLLVGDHEAFAFDRPILGALLQYPATDGAIHDYGSFVEKAHASGALVVVAADLLSLTLLKPPGEFGADIVVGSAQRFGVPMGYGGPHAAFLATRDAFKRQIPGRIVGVTKDAEGRHAVRLALQTREQHIRRFVAQAPTSNICTAQVLLAVMAGMYAVYHGPRGLQIIAERVHHYAYLLEQGLRRCGFETGGHPYFDTLRVTPPHGKLADILERARCRRINLRLLENGSLGVSLDETTTLRDLEDLLAIFSGEETRSFSIMDLVTGQRPSYSTGFARTTAFLEHPVFNRYHSETEMLRYINHLQAKDLSLADSMIPLGSCTMKLNATVEMIPVTWPQFGRMHPFAPTEQAHGYLTMMQRLEVMLADITGFEAISLQPNAGSQGEYAGLLVIRKYHQERGQGQRNVCLIPRSAHGTNPASAIMAGMKVVPVNCDADGNIDLADLRRLAEEHADGLAALMVTYPSTHGVFEEEIREICDIVHEQGGQVYMDGANMNAMVGLCRPGEFGMDVCHLNLHKTFCIPHGGGGPGMGPIGVKSHLAPYLPGHPVVRMGGEKAIGAIAAAPWGSPSILTISYAYILLMGAEGLRRATEVAILNANYVAKRLDPYYPVFYRGRNGFVAHECIMSPKQYQTSAGVEVEDIAKRLMDYGFHAPTVSFPVAGAMMIEPTESESKSELDRFCSALISIREEIAAIERGKLSREDNPLKNAPHTAEAVSADEWSHPYNRQQAAYPAPWCHEWKYWPPVARVDNVYGERNLICSCPPIEDYE